MESQHRQKELQNQKGKAPALPKGGKGKGKGKKGERSLMPTPSTNKGGDGEKGSGKGKLALTQGKAQEATMGSGKNTPITGVPSTPASSSTPQPKATVSKPGKIPKQCAHFASERGDVKRVRNACISMKWRAENQSQLSLRTWQG